MHDRKKLMPARLWILLLFRNNRFCSLVPWEENLKTAGDYGKGTGKSRTQASFVRGQIWCQTNDAKKARLISRLGKYIFPIFRKARPFFFRVFLSRWPLQTVSGFYWNVIPHVREAWLTWYARWGLEQTCRFRQCWFSQWTGFDRNGDI